MREEGVCSHCETGPRSLGKRACRTAPRYAQSRFMASKERMLLKTVRPYESIIYKILLIFHIIQMLMGCCWWFLKKEGAQNSLSF